jgi:undecaprenyl pyrophosphate synthase
VMRERCNICRKWIRRGQQDEATYWFGPAEGDGMAQLLVAHKECAEKITPDMRASIREKAPLIANTLGRARDDKSEETKAAPLIVSVGIGGDDEMFKAFQGMVAIEDDDDFVEEMEHMLVSTSLVVHDRRDGQVVLRREGVEPD